MDRLFKNLAVVLCVLVMGSGNVFAKSGEVEIAYSPDGRLLAVGGNTQLLLYTPPSLKETRSLHLSASGVVGGIAFSPDGQRLFAGHTNRVFAYDLASGQEVAELQAHQFQVTAVAISSGGAVVASGGLDGAVYLWNMSASTQLNLFESRGNFTVESLAFNADGSRLCALVNNNTLPVWDMQTHEQVVVLKGSFTGTVSFSPDGRWLAVGRDQRLDGVSQDEIVLWDPHTWELQATLTGHTGRISAVAFSPDGGQIVSASSDSTVRLWDVVRLSEVAVFRRHAESVTSVVFSPDGQTIASVDRLGAVLLWERGAWQTVVGQRSWGALKADGLGQ